MYDDWSVQQPPRVFRSVNELQEIERNDALFIRKVGLTPLDLRSWLREIGDG